MPGKANTPREVYSAAGVVKLSWKERDEGDAIRRYLVVWQPPTSDGRINMSGVVGSSAEVDKLVGNTIYTFTIRATNPAGTGEESGNISALSSESIGLL